jgi:hypothetical protein
MDKKGQQPIILWGGKEFLLPPEIARELEDRGVAISRGNRFFSPSFTRVAQRNKALRYVVEGHASMDPVKDQMGQAAQKEFHDRLDGLAVHRRSN